MTIYQFLKILYLVALTVLLAIYFLPEKKISDDDITQSHYKYCFTKNALDNAKVDYDKCAAGKDNDELIKQCRKSAYDINGITSYYSDSVELNPRFMSTFHDNAVKAILPLSNGSKLDINCSEYNNNVN